MCDALGSVLTFPSVVYRAKEHKAKLYEARMKALAGELEEEDV